MKLNVFAIKLTEILTESMRSHTVPGSGLIKPAAKCTECLRISRAMSTHHTPRTMPLSHELAE